MQAIPLGLVTVTTAGTPTPITAAMVAAAGGPANCQVAKIEAWAHANTGYVYVKDAVSGNVIAPLPVPANGNAAHWCSHAPAGGNTLLATRFALDVATSGDGAYVTLWVD
jgi:hypothetical protein